MQMCIIGVWEQNNNNFFFNFAEVSILTQVADLTHLSLEHSCIEILWFLEKAINCKEKTNAIFKC